MTERDFDIIVGPILLNKPVTVLGSSVSNPGIGGSEFHSLQLAALLSENDYKVCVLFEGAEPLMSKNISLKRFSNSERISSNFAWIVTVAEVMRVASSQIQFSKKMRIILISHHPHDGGIRKALSILGPSVLLVCVGRYQYFSNNFKGIKKAWLPTFTPLEPPRGPLRSLNGEALRFVHLSSLHPSKGFHVIARGWAVRHKKSRLGEAHTLDVLGGDALYGKSEASTVSVSKVPVGGAYGERLTNLLLDETGDLIPSIKFLGVVTDGVQRVLRNYHVAIQNPLGFAEADPMVMQDCLIAGIPVIGGTLFGMYDYQKLFPELSAHTSRGVRQRISDLEKRPALVSELSLRANAEATKLQLRRKEVEKLWIRGLSGEVRGGSSFKGLDVGSIEVSLRIRLFIGTLLTLGFRGAGNLLRLRMKTDRSRQNR